MKTTKEDLTSDRMFIKSEALTPNSPPSLRKKQGKMNQVCPVTVNPLEKILEEGDSLNSEDTTNVTEKRLLDQMAEFESREQSGKLNRPLENLTAKMKKEENLGKREVGKQNDSAIFKDYINKQLMKQKLAKHYTELDEAKYKLKDTNSDEDSESASSDEERSFFGDEAADSKAEIIGGNIQEGDDPKKEEKDKETAMKHLSLMHLQNSIKGLTVDERFEKAAQLFRDAYYSRLPRYNFSNKRILFLYNLIGHPFWNGLLRWLSWFYLFLAFFEPGHSAEQSFKPFTLDYYRNLCCELIVISFFWGDMIIDIIIKWTDIEHTKKELFIYNSKFIIMVISNICIFIDLICFYYFYGNEEAYFRFGRIIRPAYLFFYSFGMVRDIKALLATWVDIMDVLLLIIITVSIFAILAFKLFEEENSDDITNESEYRRLDWGLINLYILSSFSNYPSSVIPYVNSTTLYFLFFLPFILLVLIFFIPIPVAKIFDNWEKNRTKLFLEDRLREKQALFGIHFCIDIEEKGSFTDSQWIKFCKLVYGKDEEDIPIVMEIFNLYDVDGSKSLDIYEFLDACEILLCIHNSTDSAYMPSLVCWDALRNCCNKYFKFDKWVISIYFEIFIFLVILVNVGILITMAVTDDEDTVKTCNEIDFALLFVFVTECILKMIALGINDYFKDGWNKFDFFLVVISLTMQTALSFFRIAKFSKGAKILRVSKTAGKAKGLKAARSAKGVKSCRGLKAFFSPLTRIKEMIVVSMMNMPAILGIIALMVVLFYLYAIVGIEIFHSNVVDIQDSPWESGKYGDFSSFTMALIALFQILTQSGWHYVMLYYTGGYNTFGVILFFTSFHAIQVIIFLNLTVGLIWEVFQVTAREKVEEAKRNEEINASKQEERERKKRERKEKKEKEGGFDTPVLLEGSNSKSWDIDNECEEDNEDEDEQNLDLQNIVGAKYYLRKALMNTKDDADKIQEKEAEFIKSKFGMDRFQQALSRKEEGGFLRLKSLKGEKTENRLTKTQNQHIFSIETTNIMMEIRTVTTFEQILLMLTKSFQMIHPFLGKNAFMGCFLKEDWKNGQSLSACMDYNPDTLLISPNRIDFPLFLGQLLSIQASNIRQKESNVQPRFKFTDIDTQFGVLSRGERQEKNANLDKLASHLGSSLKISNTSKNMNVEYSLIVEKVELMEICGMVSSTPADSHTTLDGISVALIDDYIKEVQELPPPTTSGPRSLTLYLIGIVPIILREGLDRKHTSLNESHRMPLVNPEDLSDFLGLLKDVISLHRERLAKEIKQFATRLIPPDIFIPYSLDGGKTT